MPAWAYEATRNALLLIAIAMLGLALFTPWRKPGGMPHREHIWLCATGVLGLNGLLGQIGRRARDDAYVWIALLAAIFCIFAVRGFLARRAEVALEPTQMPINTPARGGA